MFEFDPDLPLTAGERAANYRARRVVRGLKTISGKSGASSKWQRGEFIALDGEGINVGDQEQFSAGDDGAKYNAQVHHYTLLAASSGESLYQGGARLKCQDCLDWLLDLGSNNPKAFFVIFAGGYDVNHILMYGFERKDLQRIARGHEFQFEVKGEEYLIEYRARKSLTLRRGKTWVANKQGGFKAKWRDRITVWDVFGFFQENFVGVMAKWLGKDHRHYELIRTMKRLRGDFANVPQAQINAYNAAELETLVEIMEKVYAAVKGLDLCLKRWDGAGAIAAAMFRKHEIKQFKGARAHDDAPDKLDFPQEVQFAARGAYAGGRIELCKIGCHNKPVFDYDKNSAYPYVMSSLPCLAHGSWRYGAGEPPKGFTLVRIKFDFADGLPFYPLYYRTSRMQISFPRDGEGWYWYPEFEAAQLCAGNMEVLEWWTFDVHCNHRPFDWIERYYNTRRQWVKNPTEEWQRGGEKIIKLGTNSLYGKCAQQLGGTDTEPPPYHQIEWAGYITSETRAQLFRLAMRDPSAIIGFATDGVFSTRELLPTTGNEKIFGQWEAKIPQPQGMTCVMAGVYWWHREDGGYEHYSRGFDKDAMKTPLNIIAAWKQQKHALDVPMHRLIGMGSACASETMWAMRGRFATGMRQLRLDGYSHKREACDVKRDKPHLHLVDLEPKPNGEYGYGVQGLSHPYPLKWACPSGKKDIYENVLEIAHENDDTMNI